MKGSWHSWSSETPCCRRFNVEHEGGSCGSLACQSCVSWGLYIYTSRIRRNMLGSFSYFYGWQLEHVSLRNVVFDALIISWWTCCCYLICTKYFFIDSLFWCLINTLQRGDKKVNLSHPWWGKRRKSKILFTVRRVALFASAACASFPCVYSVWQI